MSLLKPTTFLGRQAQRLFGAVGVGSAYQKTRKGLGGQSQRRQAEEYGNMKGTRRGHCVAAQIANGHIPDDLSDDERAYFYD